MLITQFTDDLIQSNRPSFYLAWGALNVLLLQLLFTGTLNLQSLYLSIVIGSIALVQAIQFAKQGSRFDYRTSQLSAICCRKIQEQLQDLNGFILSLGKPRSLPTLGFDLAVLTLALTFLKSTYLSVFLLVSFNFSFTLSYLQTVRQLNLRPIIDGYQEKLEGLCVTLHSQIPRYQEAKKQR